MTAEVVGKYDRPDGSFTAARGSMQILENGNAFVGWSKHSFQSEHTADGRLIQQAQFRHEGANTYRAYKYEWEGRPTQPPDVYSTAIESHNNQVDTIVYVSWNGATEVKTWNLYKTNANGEARELVGSTARQGFESMISTKGYASYVVVEALDKDGKILGESRMMETLPPPNMISPAVAHEAQWLQAHSSAGPSHLLTTLESPVITYILGIVSCAITVLVIFLLWRSKRTGGSSWWQRRAYERVDGKELDDSDFGEDTVIDEMNERMALEKSDV
jgi:hypothetical protein